MFLYLTEKGYDSEEISSVILRLEELGLIDDERYAEGFVRSRLAAKPRSKSNLFHQLRSHYVPEHIIESVLDKLSDESEFQNALTVALKFYRQFLKLEPELRRRRVLSRLQSRGFSYEISRRAYEHADLMQEDLL